jgi:hypothetical protein
MPLKRGSSVGDGVSTAYSVAVANGFTGTESQLLSSLAGTKKVTVSLVAPVDPKVNDVWIDISQL